MNISELYNLAVEHRNTHECSALPYENGEKLIAALNQFSAKNILEIGTGMGYTAAIMALTSPEILIDTIEKDPDHAQMAQNFIREQGLANQVTVINESAETYLPTVQKQYDFIFFDGYQIHYEFLPQYERLLKPNGILFLANNHLKSRTSDQFFAELTEGTKWKILDNFADTTVAQRLS